MNDTGTPGNGGARFQDLVRLVEKIDAKVDTHGEQLAAMNAQLCSKQCMMHDQQIRDLEARQLATESGAQISVAKIGGLAGVIAAAVSAIGAWLMAKGGP